MRIDSTNAPGLTRRRIRVGSTRFWRRFMHQRLALIAALLLGALVLIALFAPILAPYDPATQNLRVTLQGPSPAYWLGTDALGRDTLSRLIFGTCISLQAALFGVGIAVIIGVPIGLIAGYYGGLLDSFCMWMVDIFFVLPPLVFALALLTLLGQGLLNVVLSIGLVMVPLYVRLTRGVMLAEREQLYVESARVGGISTPAILVRHLLPNIVPPLIVQTTQLFAVALLIEAALSFLGFGVAVGEPGWGRMLAEAQRSLSRQPFLAVPPGLALTMTVLAFNVLGDGLRHAFERESNAFHRAATQKESRVSAEPAARLPSDQHPADTIPTLPLLAVRHLAVCFPDPSGDHRTILEDISFDLAPGETLGLVGESGSGKSMTALALLGLIPPPGRISAGEIWLNRRNLLAMPPAERRRVRGREMAMVFQEPMASLNPVLTIGQHLVEPLQLHHRLNRRQARARALELLAMVQVPHPHQRIDAYPHQLSGGLAQRVMIARALACNQRLLICDEPTTALDVTVQGQILDVLTNLQHQLGMAMIFISHDLAVVAEVCDRVLVLYAGQVVETGPTVTLFQSPCHPYTAALLKTLVQHDSPTERLPVLPGNVPSIGNWPIGCRFHPRCTFATDSCRSGMIPLHTLETGQASRCIRLDEIDLTVS
ncbi:MAG: dipeptide/oligopeptide/nickel ABC transporter permease/ATP-binding protein [Chloroflexaceae bacterium]|nr:dipeptide/oligopeptide/nickel ABC transporter permease/ATP-binding protein [Chloroflexaceae bacterium]